MANRKRRTQWIDSIQSTEFTILGAAAPGTVDDRTLLSEAEIENVGGGAVLTRIVGDIALRAAGADTPVTTASIMLFSNFVGSTFIVDYDADAFQRQGMLWTRIGLPTAGDAVRWFVDWRANRKMTQGMTLQLALQNHSVAGIDVEVIFHLRMLILLP